MTAGTLSATQLTKAYLQRIALTNTEGPSINAVRLLNPKALEEAAKADADRAAGTVRGPLHGIPVLVKDNLDVAGLPTTAGSVALENSVPAKDSPVVAKLRAAGAILLGKLNLSEFANFLTNGMPSGYSSLGGQVLNPYNADITPSGSSSGSGAAAATGLAAITIGTETSGSIVSPSAAQGIVGLRPTIGLVSRTGILPISATQDTAGPMTRTVADAAAELHAIAGPDPEDPATDGAPPVPDYLAGLKPDALAGKRIGVITNTGAQYVAAVAAVQALGATTVQINAPTAANTGDILTPEFKRDLNAYLGRLPSSAPMKSLADIIAYNTAHPDDALKYGQTQLTASQATDLTDPAQNAAYVTARDNGRTSARAAIDTALTTNNLEAILTPSRHADRPRRPRRLPADRRPRRVRRRHPRPGRDRVQRHGLQRGQAARVRLRLRAGDEAAQAAERDQPEPVALRARQRLHGHDARVRAEHARQRGCRLDDRHRHGAGDALAHARPGGDVPGVPPGCRADLHRVDHRQRHLHRGRGDADHERARLPDQRRVPAGPAVAGPARSGRLDRTGLQRAGRDHVPAADRRDGPAADRHLLEDADLHALDHDAVTPLTNLHARTDRGRGERSSFRRTSRPGGVHEE